VDYRRATSRVGVAEGTFDYWLKVRKSRVVNTRTRACTRHLIIFNPRMVIRPQPLQHDNGSLHTRWHYLV